MPLHNEQPSPERLRESAVERWLLQSVAPAHDAYLADPSTAISGDELRRRLAVKRVAKARYMHGPA